MVLHKYCLFSTLGFHDPKLDDHIFQMGWFNSTTNQSSEILGPGNLTSLRRLHRTVAWRKLFQRFRAVWGVWGWGFIPFAMLKIYLEKNSIHSKIWFPSLHANWKFHRNCSKLHVLKKSLDAFTLKSCFLRKKPAGLGYHGVTCFESTH